MIFNQSSFSFQSVCKLYGGASAAVMCVAVNTTEAGDHVFAGSKDHYVKTFEVSSSSSGCLTPKFNLEPPHYDGIQSIAINKGMLYSGSRDACIKKWDLEKRAQVKVSHAFRVYYAAAMVILD